MKNFIRRKWLNLPQMHPICLIKMHSINSQLGPLNMKKHTTTTITQVFRTPTQFVLYEVIFPNVHQTPDNKFLYKTHSMHYGYLTKQVTRTFQTM